MSELIILENAKKVFDVDKMPTTAFENINFKVEKGELIAIMGPSGCGKSSLVSVIGCMDSLTEGKYFFDGTEINRKNINSVFKLRNEKIAFIFQNFALVKDFTVAENVGLPLKVRKMPKSELKKNVLEALEYVGLTNLKDKIINKLSGGEQQRVAIARALAQNTDLILADEPTGALDQRNGSNIISILKRLNEEKGKTIIIITHDPNVAKVCNRIEYLLDGEFVESLEF
ncbi:ABC transporter ATP-binding protein [uncultured Clostridium sp.]|jgi:putative ABC transport system ATP-binding protein|uniref:ABC transporter ATP-binding protein n=1 Tax=uncultured Clostridium sp. TaxID=59620 RepID=UPI00261F1F7E|nr:ABC transporter ATP-binding protein [uncultured Clostridium sp.]